MSLTKTEKRRIIGKLRRSKGNFCFYCRVRVIQSKFNPPIEPNARTLDHKTPLSRGGTNHFDNLEICCLACNQRKGDLDASEFMGPAARPAVERTPLFSMPSSPDDRP